MADCACAVCLALCCRYRGLEWLVEVRICTARRPTLEYVEGRAGRSGDVGTCRVGVGGWGKGAGV